MQYHVRGHILDDTAPPGLLQFTAPVQAIIKVMKYILFWSHHKRSVKHHFLEQLHQNAL